MAALLARAAADRALVATLRANGRTRWHIEYGAFGLSNHLAHGVIALRHLGATDTMVAAWIKTYEVHQTAGNTLEKARVADRHAVADANDARANYLGRRRNFLGLCDFFDGALARDGRAAVLRAWLPSLAPGFAAAAFHALIHTGYGAVVADEHAGGDEHLLADGLAYCVFSHEPLGPLPPPPTAPTAASSPGGDGGDGNAEPPDLGDAIVAALARVRAEGRFEGLVARHGPAWLARPYWSGRGMSTDSFQLQFAVLTEEPGALALLSHYLNADAGAGGSVTGALARCCAACAGRPDVLGARLFGAALRVYAGAARDDFFLLHGVTAAWSLAKLLPFFPDDAAREAAVGHFLVAVLATYVAQGKPAITAAPTAADGDEEEDLLPDWDAIVGHTLNGAEFKDEHQLKLVMNCREVAARGAAGDAALAAAVDERTLRWAAARKAGLLPW